MSAVSQTSARGQHHHSVVEQDEFAANFGTPSTSLHGFSDPLDVDSIGDGFNPDSQIHGPTAADKAFQKRFVHPDENDSHQDIVTSEPASLFTRAKPSNVHLKRTDPKIQEHNMKISAPLHQKHPLRLKLSLIGYLC